MIDPAVGLLPPEFQKRGTTQLQTRVLAFEWHASYFQSLDEWLPDLAPSHNTSGTSSDQFHSVAARMTVLRKFFRENESVRLDKVWVDLRRVTNSTAAPKLKENLTALIEHWPRILNSPVALQLTYGLYKVRRTPGDFYDLTNNGLLVHGDIGKGMELRAWGARMVQHAVWLAQKLPDTTFTPGELVLETRSMIQRGRDQEWFTIGLPPPYPPVW